MVKDYYDYMFKDYKDINVDFKSITDLDGELLYKILQSQKWTNCKLCGKNLQKNMVFVLTIKLLRLILQLIMVILLHSVIWLDMHLRVRLTHQIYILFVVYLAKMSCLKD